MKLRTVTIEYPPMHNVTTPAIIAVNNRNPNDVFTNFMYLECQYCTINMMYIKPASQLNLNRHKVRFPTQTGLTCILLLDIRQDWLTF